MAEEVEKNYDWLIKNEDGTFTVETTAGKFIMEELTDEQVERASKMAEKTNGVLTKFLAVRSLKEPKLTDAEFSALKSSVSMRLKFVAAKINGMTDFL